MHSSNLFNILSAAALFALTEGAPVAQGPSSKLAERGIYSKCKLPSGLDWDGECSVDPCGQWISWCPDYEYGTKVPVNQSNSPTPKPAPETPDMTKGAYYKCAASGFDGTCSYDPCDGQKDSWCNDYILGSYTPKGSIVPAPQPSDNGGFAPLTSYSKCQTIAGLFWDGFCTEDPCTKNLGWCPDFEWGTMNPLAAKVQPVDPKDWIKPADGKPVYTECKLAASNLQWKGFCSVDPCINNLGWCPDLPYAQYGDADITKRGLIYSKCTLKTGLAWDGWCSQDPCGNWQEWCVDYQVGTWIPKTVDPAVKVPATPEVGLPAPQTCAASETRFEPNAGNTCKFGSGLNFYTCQNNGFKGCCSSDPCAKDWCPDYKQGCYNA